MHLAWAFPLPRPAYLLGGEGLHSLLMFAPIVCVSPAKGLETALLLIFTGPVLAMILANTATGTYNYYFGSNW